MLYSESLTQKCSKDHLIEAAESLGDKLVLGILHGAFDWNSHADTKRTQSEYGLIFRHSKRKKREHCESWGGAWNDGVDDGGAYDKDRRARARRYTTKCASVQMFNKRRGLELQERDRGW